MIPRTETSSRFAYAPNYVKAATLLIVGERDESMGDDAVIIEGIDSPISREALFSTVHGAGRIMSRTAARGRFELVGDKRIRRAGLVRHDEMMKWMTDRTLFCAAAMWMKRRKFTGD